MKTNTPTNTLFARPIDRLLELEKGQIISYPVADYWRVNARRTRAMAATGGSYSLRVRGEQVFVLRVS